MGTVVGTGAGGRVATMNDYLCETNTGDSFARETQKKNLHATSREILKENKASI